MKIKFSKKELTNAFDQGIPVFVYGNGTYAKIVKAEVERIGGYVSGNFVDDDSSSFPVNSDIRWSMLPDLTDQALSITQLSSLDEPFVVILGINGVFKTFTFPNCIGTFYVDAMLGDLWEDFDESWIESFQRELDFTRSLLDETSLMVFNSFLDRRLNFVNGSEGFSKENIYFNPLIKLRDGLVVVDCGAYDGDTLKDYLRFCSPSKYYCIEPDRKNFNDLEAFVVSNSLSDLVELHNVGVSDKKDLVRFSDNKGLMSNEDKSGDSEIVVDTIDNILNNHKVDIIKLDVEGSELAALKGAETSLQRSRPYLLISLYHRPTDLFEIPKYIFDLGLNYEFKLRQHYIGPSTGTPMTDLVLYCLPC